MNSVETRRAERRSASRSETNWLRPAIVAWLLFTAFAATILFGAVDPISTGLLAIAAAITVLLWIADSWKAEVIAVNLDELYLPIIGLIVIGIIQMLPLRGDSATQGLLSIPLSSALSLDPYATRIFTARLVIMLVFFAAASTYVDSKRNFSPSVSSRRSPRRVPLYIGSPPIGL